ncbi:polysaccharide deacetylase family protein [Thalassotalea agarivorans]|uniref:Peptidoglycan/xylan/chitin deacetylase, PgdA/CDA1 family n=1 Tax=Thalassotalea agarivorans TaxID=349064 RepID=A0A1H9Y5N8_THASX|nr:polysaccharide deacetylase family protein [Thalassotalea agarivorans]SES64197.1 Peptidoglycan/xylan/chitin deacetylase, PgdA/CDA1 family [Thalassotalea agarivorans]
MPALRVSVLCLLAIATTSAFAQQQLEFKWPNNAKIAVSLGYDDSLASHLDTAVKDLNDFKLKGTFYLTLSHPSIANRIDEWRDVAKQGHELANHSLFHPCSATPKGREWVSEANNLDTKTIAAMAQEIQLANHYLHAIDGNNQRTFTAPCGDQFTKNGNYLPAIANLFEGMKTHIGPSPKNIASLNRMDLPTWAPHQVDGKTLIDYVKSAEKTGTIASFTFHGIGADHLAVSQKAHRELLAYLSEHSDKYYVDTYLNISLYLKRAQQQP